MGMLWSGTIMMAKVNSYTLPPLPMKKLDTLWRFSRPHTLIGTALSVPALHVLAMPVSVWTEPSMTISIVQALAPAVLVNLYITGLNQLTDIDLDRINKPHLPLVSGDLSREEATAVILAALVGAFLLCPNSPPLQITLTGSAVLGTLYSLSPFRWKQYPALAAACIVVVRGLLVNVGFYGHALVCVSHQVPQPFLSYLQHTRCLLTTVYFSVFALVIAWMKDIPDVKGDRLYSIFSYSVVRGPSEMLQQSHLVWRGLLLVTSIISLLGGYFLPGIIAVIAYFDVQDKYGDVDAENPQQVTQHYMHLWKLFYLSYLLLPWYPMVGESLENSGMIS